MPEKLSEAMVCRILGSAFVASPPSISGREGTPEEVSTAMMCRILGSVVVAFPQSVFGREGTPEELFEAMACRILGSLCCLPAICFRVREYAREAI